MRTDLLRGFDLDLAKDGEPICTRNANERILFVGLDSRGMPVIEMARQCLVAMPADDLRMKPLCWVQEQPVYEGAKLWTPGGKSRLVVRRMDDRGRVCGYLEDEQSGLQLPFPIHDLTWDRPRRTITIGSMTINAPETEPLKLGQEYFRPILGSDGATASRFNWSSVAPGGDGVDKRHLASGLVFLTERDALAAAEALLKMLQQ